MKENLLSLAKENNIYIHQSTNELLEKSLEIDTLSCCPI